MGSEGCACSAWKRGGSGEGDLIPIFSLLEAVPEHEVRFLRGAQQKDERQQTPVVVKEILIKHIEKEPLHSRDSHTLEEIAHSDLRISISGISELKWTGPEQPHTPSKVSCSAWRTKADDLQKPPLA